MKFAHYIKATGEVISILNIPESRRDLHESDEYGLIDMGDDDMRNDTNLVIVDGELVDKTPILDPDGTHWEFVPEGTKIFIDGDEVGTMNGDEELTLALGRGTYDVRMVPPLPYLDGQWTVEIP